MEGACCVGITREDRMEFGRIWVLRGPNIWARVPVLEVELLQGSAEAPDPGAAAAVTQRLRDQIPGLRLVHAEGQPLRIVDLLQRLTLDLQALCGSPVEFGLACSTPEPGLYRVVVEYEEEEIGRACLDAARDACLAGLADSPYDGPARLAALREMAQDLRLGPSTRAIVEAAKRRNIPVRRLNRDSLVQLGYGTRQCRICAAETDRTGAIAEAIAQDKELTRSLLQTVGVPVPEGRPVSDPEDAWCAAEELGLPVVVKPQDGNHGRGVATNLSTREQVVRAFAAARDEGSRVIVERFIPGVDYRLLVVGDRLAAAALRAPAQVVGDGRSTIAQLIEEVNRDPRRSDGHATVLSRIKLDAVALGVLADQGYAPDSIPPSGAHVLIRRNANLSTGGTAMDVTDVVHPDVAARAIEAARVVGLDIAGVDIVATDIGRPLEIQRGAVVEVNAGPGLRMHLEPSFGEARPVGEAVVSMLFPEGQAGRIPIVAVTGVNGKTTTTRLIAHLLQGAGRTIGMACTDGLYLDNRRINARDCSGPRSARAVLGNPLVHAAVLETARGGILREGLGFDRCDVAVVTNIGGGDHLSLRGIETVDDLARVKRTVVEAVADAGRAVLNAADPLVVAMADHCPGKVIYFARDADNPVLAAHQRLGGQSVFVRNGSVTLARDDREQGLVELDRVPLTHGGLVGFQIENVLAGVAAAWALDTPLEVLRDLLETFRGDALQAPGRFNVLSSNGATVIVDYAHNPSALAALVEALDQFPHRRRSLVFTACNRRDIDVVRMGEIIGDGFERVVLYQDQGNNDRTDGDLNALLRQGLARATRVKEVSDVSGELAAIEQALYDLRADDLVVIGVESIDQGLTHVQALLAARDPSAQSAISVP
jgi:cyanophycin synthetase